MRVKGRKVFGFIVTNAMLLIITLGSIAAGVEIPWQGWVAIAVVVAVNNLIFTMGNILAKALTPENIKEFLIKQNG